MRHSRGMVEVKMAALALVLILVLAVCVMVFLRSVMGKPVLGTLHVPLGNNHVDVTPFDCRCLKPYKCGQVFDVAIMPTEHTMVSQYSGLKWSGRGAIAFKGTPVGFANERNPYVRVLWKLAGMYPKVLVKAVILGVDSSGQPVMRLNLPKASWFSRAAKNMMEMQAEGQVSAQ